MKRTILVFAFILQCQILMGSQIDEGKYKISDNLKEIIYVNDKSQDSIFFKASEIYFATYAVTAKTKNDLILAICGKGDGNVLVAFNAITKKPLWDFKDPRLEDIDKLEWVSDTLALASVQGRHFFTYVLFDVVNKRVLTAGSLESGAVQFKNGKLIEVMPINFNSKKSDPNGGTNQVGKVLYAPSPESH